MSAVILFGGHGKVALLAQPLLVAAGHSVTAVIRSSEQAEAIRAAGAEPLLLDLEQATTGELTEAIAGHDAVVWSAGAGGGNPTRTYAIDRDAAIASMDAAARADVSRYVMVSYQGAALEHGIAPDHFFFAYAEAKAAADDHLRRSTLDWTILGPGRLTDDAPSGTIRLGPATDEDRDGGGPGISRADVAQTIVTALAFPATIGTTLEYLDGPTPIDEAFGA